MPIYIVRWSNPNPSICLIKARNEAEVLAIMDQIADPTYCRVKEYKGPLLFSLDLGLKYHMEPDEIGKLVSHTVVDDVGECPDEIPLELAEISTTLEVEMKEEIIRTAFPHYSDYMNKRWERGEEPATEDEADCKKAIQQDFDDIEKEIRDKLM